METLSGKRLGIDIDAETAFAELTAIDAKLAELGSRSPNVQVRADIATARAEIAEMQRQVNDLDRDDVRIRVTANTAQAHAALLQLGVALGAVAAIPLVPVAAAGIGAIASAAVAAGAGVGALALVAVPAIKSVTSVIQAKSAAEKEAATSTSNAAAANVRAAQSAMQMAGAQAALRNAHRQAADSIAQANRQVENAERAVAQAAQRAMEQRRQAAESVEQAERSLADAKRQAQQAEEDLTQARKDAAQQLRDLNDQLLDGLLDERDAALRVQEAREELNRVLADPTATDLQRERAQLSVDEAVRNADKQRAKNAELKKSADEAHKAGIDGNEGVKRALEQQADAQQNVRDQTDALARAHQDAARAQVEAAQTVSDAQRNLADAVGNAANTQVQAVESIASAERGVEAARLSGIDTTAKAASKADEYRQALAKLTPEQRDLYDSIAGPKGLTAAFKEWVRELQPDVLPLFARAVNGAKNSLPGLSPLVRNSADAVGELFDRASADLKRPFWQRFKQGITGSAHPAIVGLGVAIGNTFKGAAGVVDAFLPHMDSISDRAQRITGRFANWGTSLRGSPEFEGFLDYAAEMGPIVAEALGDIGGAFLDVGQALAPLSGPVLRVIGAIASGISTIAQNAPWFVQGIWLAVVATKAWALAMVALNFALNANPIVRIAVLVGVLVGAVVLAYERFGWFRAAVQATWEAVQVAFSAIGFAARVLFAVLVTVVLTPIILVVKAVGAIAMWLWREAFRPAFTNIATVSKWVWEKALQPVLRWIWDGLRWVGEKFLWLHNKTVRPVFDWIADKAEWVYFKGLKPAFDRIRTAIGLVSDSFKSARKIIETAWNAVAGVAAKPVNWVINWVYNKGIKATWDAVADFVGLDPLPKAPKLLEAPQKFERGGRTRGGIPGVDSIPILAMEDEYVIRRDSARKLGFGTLDFINRTGELPRFADGGIVGALGSAWDWTRDTVGGAVSKGVDWAKTGADLIANPSKIWAKLMKPILDKVKSHLDVGGLGATLAKVPPKMVNGLKDKIVNAATGFLGGGGGNLGNGQWARPVNAPFGTRFGVAGPMWSSGYHTGLDFPAPTGTPIRAADKGQVVGAASGGPYGNHVIVSHGAGLASLYAHMSRMAASVGQSVTRGQTIGAVGATGNVTGPHLHFEARQSGRTVDPMPFLYDDGGYLQPGMNLVANGTGKPEPVLTSAQWDAMAAGKGGGRPVTINVESRTYLDGREVGGIIDERINVYDGESARALDNGRVTI
ncbi:peptidoglycan DD-metalloendopeptidase family protein [Streptomyces sp. NPDC003877]